MLFTLSCALLVQAGTREEWVAEYQGMVGLAGSQVWWTWEVEDVFRKVAAGDKKAMKTYVLPFLFVRLILIINNHISPALSVQTTMYRYGGCTCPVLSVSTWKYIAGSIILVRPLGTTWYELCGAASIRTRTMKWNSI